MRSPAAPGTVFSRTHPSRDPSFSGRPPWKVASTGRPRSLPKSTHTSKRAYSYSWTTTAEHPSWRRTLARTLGVVAVYLTSRRRARQVRGELRSLLSKRCLRRREKEWASVGGNTQTFVPVGAWTRRSGLSTTRDHTTSTVHTPTRSRAST